MDAILAFLPRTDEELITALTIVHIIGTFGTLVTAMNPIPYGRYANIFRLTGWSISGQNLWRAFSITWLLPISVALFTDCKTVTNIPNLAAIALFIIHYVYRSLIYPGKCMRNASRWPIESAVTALTACAFNGFIQGYHLLHVHKVRSIGISSILGLAMFTVGLTINISHDEMLAGMRKSTRSLKGSDPKSRYSIPSGGLFNYVSAANYFGEIVEWWGWAIFCGGIPQIVFGLSTTFILGIRGWQHHQFYKRTFLSVYPKNRRAVIPFLL